jgi:hypothetical protein
MSQDARDHLAERLRTHCEPALARVLTGGKSDRLTSEQAHRAAAEIARQTDAGRAPDKSSVVKETTR